MNVSLSENLCNGHEVLCQSTSLIGADVISTSHGFAGLKISDQVVFFFHLSDWIRQGNGHWQWETFGDSNDDDTDSDDEEFNKFVNCCHWDEWVDEAFLQETVVNVVEEHSRESCSSTEHADLSDLIGQDGQFLLKWSLVLILLNL